MRYNKKGLSDIVVTLIIVLLSIVAIGVVWSVINGLIKNQSQGVASGSKCLTAVVDPTSLNCANDSDYFKCTIDLQRQTQGSETPLAGVELVFIPYNTTSKQSLSKVGPIDLTGDVPALVGKRATDVNTTRAYSTDLVIKTVEATPYFLDDSGQKQRCQNTRPYTIAGYS
ncbi:hypothetical protein GYA25_03575 [Candidatus Woesearchaeota archaeon]|nr:hypothetical protein [Candidatus Woesearchaeota archaeon]